MRLHPGHQVLGALREVGRLAVVDTLTDGKSGNAACQGRLAAPTVPERAAKGPMFSPRLIPETTRSGRCGMPWSSMAQMTVSAG